MAIKKEEKQKIVQNVVGFEGCHGKFANANNKSCEEGQGASGKGQTVRIYATRHAHLIQLRL